MHEGFLKVDGANGANDLPETKLHFYEGEWVPRGPVLCTSIQNGSAAVGSSASTPGLTAVHYRAVLGALAALTMVLAARICRSFVM